MLWRRKFNSIQKRDHTPLPVSACNFITSWHFQPNLIQSNLGWNEFSSVLVVLVLVLVFYLLLKRQNTGFLNVILVFLVHLTFLRQSSVGSRETDVRTIRSLSSPSVVIWRQSPGLLVLFFYLFGQVRNKYARCQSPSAGVSGFQDTKMSDSSLC